MLAPAKFSLEPGRQLDDQLLTVAGAGTAALLLFNEFSANEPVGPHHLRVDRAGDLGAGLFEDLANLPVQGVEPGPARVRALPGPRASRMSWRRGFPVVCAFLGHAEDIGMSGPSLANASHAGPDREG